MSVTVVAFALPVPGEVHAGESAAANDDEEVLRVEVTGPREAILGMPSVASQVTVEATVHDVAHDPAVRAALTLNGRPVWRRSLGRSVGGGAPLALSINRLPLWHGENEFELAVTAESGRTATVNFQLTRNRPGQSWPASAAQRERTAPLPAAPRWLHGDRVVQRELVVPAGESLTIRAGTVLRFAPSAGITVHGTLEVDGEAEAPVWFVPATLDARWANVVVHGEAAAATFRHTVFYRGGGRADDWVEERTVPRVPQLGEPDAAADDEDAPGRDGGALMVLGTRTDEPAVRLFDCRVLDNLASVHDDEWGLGGGLFVERAAVAVSRTTFVGNHAGSDGGAIYAFQDAALTLTQCRFEANAAERDGGAVAAVANDVLRISESSFERNLAGRNGGALNFNAESVADVDECRFADNAAARIGGAFLIVRNQRATFNASRFMENRAGQEGGAGMCAEDANVSLEGCTFARNEAGTTGGGLTIRNSTPTLTNCDVMHNRAQRPDGAGGIFVRYGNQDNGDNPEAQTERLTRAELEASNRIRNNRPKDLVLDE